MEASSSPSHSVRTWISSLWQTITSSRQNDGALSPTEPTQLPSPAKSSLGDGAKASHTAAQLEDRPTTPDPPCTPTAQVYTEYTRQSYTPLSSTIQHACIAPKKRSQSSFVRRLDKARHDAPSVAGQVLQSPDAGFGDVTMDSGDEEATAQLRSEADRQRRANLPASNKLRKRTFAISYLVDRSGKVIQAVVPVRSPDFKPNSQQKSERGNGLVTKTPDSKKRKHDETQKAPVADSLSTAASLLGGSSPDNNKRTKRVAAKKAAKKCKSDIWQENLRDETYIARNTNKGRGTGN